MTTKANHILEKIAAPHNAGMIKSVMKGTAATLKYMGKQFMRTPKPVIAAGTAAGALAIAPHKGPLSPVHHHEKQANMIEMDLRQPLRVNYIHD